MEEDLGVVSEGFRHSDGGPKVLLRKALGINEENLRRKEQAPKAQMTRT